MPKNKRRRTVDSVQSLAKLHNLTGIDEGVQEESVASCMAEFGQETMSKVAENANTANENCAVARKAAWEDQQVDRDRVEAWNCSFLAWTQGGNYAPSLLPSVDEELARHFQLQELSNFVLKQGEDLRMPIFERWLLDARLEDQSSPDPILPTSLDSLSNACQRLCEELVESGLDQGKAEGIVDELRRRANVAGQEIASKADQQRRSSPLKKGDRMEIEDKGAKISLLYSRKKWKKPFHFSLNKEHYQKLKNHFLNVHGRSDTRLDERSQKVLCGFHVIVVAMLLRYSSLSGGQLLQDLRGGGMQGAVHERVFEILRKTWDCSLVEGFASPFNASLPVFGSAFPDLDWHFGSNGTFLQQSYLLEEGCCCEANPPFSPAVMTNMVDHMEKQINKADRAGVALSFFIVVPTTCSGKERVVQQAALSSFQRMVTGKSCRMHIQLPAREHGYVEGAQHLRGTRYKQSSYDTSVIILQSKKGLRQDIREIEFEKSIRLAFASQHEQELRKRKQSSVTK